jgi:hypothetical protein
MTESFEIEPDDEQLVANEPDVPDSYESEPPPADHAQDDEAE